MYLLCGCDDMSFEIIEKTELKGRFNVMCQYLLFLYWYRFVLQLLLFSTIFLSVPIILSTCTNKLYPTFTITTYFIIPLPITLPYNYHSFLPTFTDFCQRNDTDVCPN